MSRTPPTELLGTLVSALRRDAMLAWCVEHARDGDPLLAAWDACAWPFVMMSLLSFVASTEESPSRWTRAFHAWCLVSRQHRGCAVDPCMRCAATINTAVPVPPTLAELLAIRARRIA